MQKNIWEKSNIHYWFKKKSISKLGIEGNFLNLIRDIYKYIYRLQSGIMKGCPFSSLSFNIVLEVSSQCIDARERSERNPNWKGRSKTVFISKRHDWLCRKLNEIYEEISRTYKGAYQGCRTQSKLYFWMLSWPKCSFGISMVLLLFSHKVLFDSLWTHGLQHTRLPCPSLSPRVYSNLCPLSWWCYLTISSSATLFSSCP